jgi:hypothetical protein
MTKPTEHQLNLINDVIEEFEFEKVHIAMIALDWKWIAPNGAITNQSMAVPTIARLKQTAIQVLTSSIESGFARSGGFVARYSTHEKLESFTLSFVVAEYDTWNDD